MSSAIIQADTLQFITDLSSHNDRDWFQENKHRYEAGYANMIAFADALMDKMSEIDHLVPMTGKKMLFRIYRDVRFSKDKSPYKLHWDGRMKRATEELRGGYYFRVAPGGSAILGGFFGPEPADLKLIRDEIAADDKPLRAIIADKTFKKYFGELRGDEVKTAPKGFSKEHPAIDLIRKKAFLLRRDFSDKEVLSKNYLDKVQETFAAMRPFLDYMSEVLTLDGNGVRK